MTFTSTEMQQARYTTRGLTLDLVNDVTKDCIERLATVEQLPADGLSMSEAFIVAREATLCLRRMQALGRVLDVLYTKP